MSRSIALTVAVLAGGLLLSSCAQDSGSEDCEFQVISEVVSHEAIKDMLVSTSFLGWLSALTNDLVPWGGQDSNPRHEG